MTNDKGNPNDQNPNRSAGLLFGTILHGGTHNAARNWGSAFGFMKRIDQSEFVHCCQHTLALPRRTKSADKSDALQTLRALLRHPAGAKRLECVRLQRRFPDGAWDSLARQVNRGLSLAFRMHWDLEQVRRRPPPRGPITQSRARTRMTTRTTGHSTEWTWRRAFLGVALAVASLPLAVGKIRATEVGTSE